MLVGMSILRKPLCPLIHRPASTACSLKLAQNNKMHAWQVHSFGGIDQLSLTDSVRIPVLTGPNDILVQVSTTSINPIDIAMMGMYL